jgi:hypothetical protein
MQPVDVHEGSGSVVKELDAREKGSAARQAISASFATD